PFGGISFNLNPAYGSKIDWKELERDKRHENEERGDILVRGNLQGKFPANQPVDGSIVASDGKSYGGTAKTDPSGAFTIRIRGVPSGKGDVMVYYFGPNMTPSSDGPRKAKIP